MTRKFTPKKSITDLHIGQRIRFLRKKKGYSLQELGSELALTHQQIQKYENGANRIFASRLYEISKIFDTHISYFFESLPDTIKERTMEQLDDIDVDSFQENLPANYEPMFEEDKELTKIISLFSRIHDPEKKKVAVEFLRTLVRMENNRDN